MPPCTTWKTRHSGPTSRTHLEDVAMWPTSGCVAHMVMPDLFFLAWPAFYFFARGDISVMAKKLLPQGASNPRPLDYSLVCVMDWHIYYFINWHTPECFGPGLGGILSRVLMGLTHTTAQTCLSLIPGITQGQHDYVFFSFVAVTYSFPSSPWSSHGVTAAGRARVDLHSASARRGGSSVITIMQAALRGKRDLYRYLFLSCTVIPIILSLIMY